MTRTTGTVLPVLALVLTGLSTGVFAAYAVAVMPGLARTDDATFVSAFSAIDRAIVGPVYLLGIFFGAPALILVVALTRATARPGLVWVALGLAVVAVVITLAVNVPLNDAIKAAAPDADPRGVRAAFHESRWAVANAVRTLLDLGALAVLGLAVRG